ncbi:MAG: DUF917 family protein [Anaerolineaceae bacterium]|nr:DUF917 family protein [Anaerolineaceae bacterium]
MKLSIDDVRAAVLGGAVLGGGGGGSMENGLELGERALRVGEPELVQIAEVPQDGIQLTCSYVGSPAAKHIHVEPEAYIRSVEMVVERIDSPVCGLISNECGGTAVVNGWFQGAVLGIPVVDAPCNGRAHPTGAMGSMGLHALPGYISMQAAAGGEAGAGRYLEMVVRGDLECASKLIRQASIQAGGMVAVARNPVEAGYVRRHGAPGAVQKSMEVGRLMLDAVPHGGAAVCEAAAAALDGKIIESGTVRAVVLSSSGGFDTGRVKVGDYELVFWNEYMTLEKNAVRIGTFPDLIMTLDAHTGMPVTSAQILEGQQVALLLVPQQKLILGAGMFYPELYAQGEEALGMKLVKR